MINILSLRKVIKQIVNIPRKFWQRHPAYL